MKFKAKIEISTAKLRGSTKHAHIVSGPDGCSAEVYSNNPDEVTISLKAGDILDKADSGSAYATFTKGEAMQLFDRLAQILEVPL